ncbi:MAG: SH3 domain-containing protein [Deltaproteobacteria bacterium]|nr:SH3 domain-containing protein [Deltaproteobacteria bacterium]
MKSYTINAASDKPQSSEEIENLKKEKLKNLSLNFELDLIRLSKTIRLISQSENISKDYILYLENRLKEFHENLAGFVKNSLDLEEETSKLSLKSVEKNGELGEKLNTYIKEMIALLNVHLNYSRKIKDDLEKRTKEYIDNLDSTRKLHKKELQELHSRLIKQQNSISDTFIDMSILDDKKSTFTNKSEERAPIEKKPPDSLSDSASSFFKHPAKNSIQSPMNSAIKHKEITYIIMLVIFVYLFFMFFNDGKESKKTQVSSKSETVYSWEIPKRENPGDKELIDSRIQEAKSANEEEIINEIKYEAIESNPSKNEVERETIKEPPSEKQILALTVPAANLRKGPNKKYPVAFVVKSGDVIEKLDERGNWIKIRTQSGDEGWIWKKLVRGEVE